MDGIEPGQLRGQALAELQRLRAQLGLGLEAGVDRVREHLRQVRPQAPQGLDPGADPAGSLRRGVAAGDRVIAGPALVGGQGERVDVGGRAGSSPSACSGVNKLCRQLT